MNEEESNKKKSIWDYTILFIVVIITLIALYFLVPVIGYPVEVKP